MSASSPPRPGSGAMFDGIAVRYDSLNRVISLGLDGGWRRRMVRALDLEGRRRVLDVATGTADLALELARAGAETRIVGLDAAPRMLQIAARKVAQRGLEDRIELLPGDASDLPFPTGSFDACTMAFGIRNMPDRLRVLQEMRRVIRPGGRVAILELSDPRVGWLAPLLRWHVHNVVPVVGSLLSGAAAYGYLSRSIAAFPPPFEFLLMLREAGFHDTRLAPMTLGVAHVYTGYAGGTA